jgi:DNA-binding CsgD family transcriptional regulator
MNSYHGKRLDRIRDTPLGCILRRPAPNGCSQDIISPLLQRFVNAKILLTPQEMQVASLVKDGKTSKEIADVLNVSATTVNFHRKNLRVKFGLRNKRTNLRSYLMSIS